MDLEIWASIKHGSMNSFLPFLAMINMKKANFLLTNWLFWLNLSSNFFLFKVQSKGGSHKRRRSENTLHWIWQTVWKVVISMDDMKPFYKFVSYICISTFHLMSKWQTLQFLQLSFGHDLVLMKNINITFEFYFVRL